MFFFIALCLLSSSYMTVDCFADRCGLSNIAGYTKILGGTEARAQSWPWMARLKIVREVKETVTPLMRDQELYDLVVRSEKVSECGGSLLNSRWVLTAAQCVKNDPKLIRVYLGDHSVETENEPGELAFESQEWIIHENYNNRTNENDIALVRLPKTIDFGTQHHIQPICLTSNDTSLDNCVITGWGKTDCTIWDETGGNGHHIKKSDVLLEAPITINADPKCEGSAYFQPGYQFCAGDGQTSPMKGDSGGPLVCKNVLDVWVQKGITSHGKKCKKGAPAIYTRVASYLDWIKRNTGVGPRF